MSELVGASKVSGQFLGSVRDLLGDVGLDINICERGGGHTLPLSPGENPPAQNVLKTQEPITVTAVLYPTGTPEGSVQVPAHGTAPKSMVTNL